MYDRSIIDVVDNAIDRHRHCSACGAPNMVLAEDSDELFVVCSKIVGTPSGRLARLSAIIFPHDRLAILS